MRNKEVNGSDLYESLCDGDVMPMINKLAPSVIHQIQVQLGTRTNVLTPEQRKNKEMEDVVESVVEAFKKYLKNPEVRVAWHQFSNEMLASIDIDNEVELKVEINSLRDKIIEIMQAARAVVFASNPTDGGRKSKRERMYEVCCTICNKLEALGKSN